MDADPGYSIWIILLLIALLFAVLWGGMALFLAFGAWFIGRSRILDDEPRPKSRDRWEAPPDQEPPPPRP